MGSEMCIRDSSDRTSLRSPHLVRAGVVWEAKRDEKLGLRRPLFYFEAPWTVYSVLEAVGPRAAAAAVALPLEIAGSHL